MQMATRVPEGFRITDSAMKAIRPLVKRPYSVAYVCWVTTQSVTTGETTFDGWSVTSFEERDGDDPVEISGVRFLFDPSRTNELVGKTLDCVDGHGFRLI